MNYQRPITLHISTDWQDQAACSGVGYDIFFPEESHNTSPKVYAKALRFCRDCPVRRECLEYAMYWEKDQFRRFGMFGGLTPRERDALSYTAQ